MREAEFRAALAWQIANFMRAKKLPRFNEVVKALNANKRQSGREQYRQMSKWLAQRNSDLARMKEQQNGGG